MDTPIVLFDTNAVMPTKGTPEAAGYDLYSTESGIIKSNNRKMINTGIKMIIPKGYYGRIAPRSGLALKKGIDIFAGVIDSDYRNEIKCILYNSDEEHSYTYQIGDRIAQIIIEKYYDVNFINVTNFDDDINSHSGFGSTGK
jgi:dUTP pyrophosphatase